MSRPPESTFDSQMEPWRDWSQLDEQDAINKLKELAEDVRRTTTFEVGRVAVIGVANYTLEVSKDWPDLLALASALEEEFTGPGSPRIGR